MGIGAFTPSTSGMEHGSCSVVRGLGFLDSTAEEAMKGNLHLTRKAQRPE